MLGGRTNLSKGHFYERKACDYLRKKGYEIVSVHYRFAHLEVDIIACREKTLVFCEVKFRSAQKHFNPFDAIGKKKRENIGRCSIDFLEKHKEWKDFYCRYDAIFFIGKHKHPSAKSDLVDDVIVEHFEDIFRI